MLTITSTATAGRPGCRCSQDAWLLSCSCINHELTVAVDPRPKILYRILLDQKHVLNRTSWNPFDRPYRLLTDHQLLTIIFLMSSCHIQNRFIDLTLMRTRLGRLSVTEEAWPLPYDAVSIGVTYEKLEVTSSSSNLVALKHDESRIQFSVLFVITRKETAQKPTIPQCTIDLKLVRSYIMDWGWARWTGIYTPPSPPQLNPETD